MHSFFTCERPYPLPDGRNARCRRCAECVKMRQRLWTARAVSEALCAPRTWWCTLTYEGDKPPSYASVQSFLKGVRKTHEVRYMASEERGSEHNRLHWHMLLHCQSTLKKRQLEALWPEGFSKFVLASGAGLAGYIAKYAGKPGSGMRASPYYGRIRIAMPEGTSDNLFLWSIATRIVLGKRFPRKPKYPKLDLAEFRARWKEMDQSVSIGQLSELDVINTLKEAPMDRARKSRFAGLQTLTLKGSEVELDPSSDHKVTTYDGCELHPTLDLATEDQSHAILA